MSKQSNIGWTQGTWNPLMWNCTPTSPGCAHCYAMELARKFPARANGGDFLAKPALRESAWKEVKSLDPGPCFVCSMSDLFHPDVETRWIHRIFNTFSQRPDVTWLVLTKRIERAAALAPYLAWGPNVWIGTTVESQDYVWRLDYLRGITQAAGRFVSFEPLLGPIVAPDLGGIQWIILGGESGLKRRAFDKAWAKPLWNACLAHDTRFFFKQGSDRYPGRDRLLWGREWNETPEGWHWAPEHAEAVARPPVQLELFAAVQR
jgi:protein gp37